MRSVLKLNRLINLSPIYLKSGEFLDIDLSTLELDLKFIFKMLI